MPFVDPEGNASPDAPGLRLSMLAVGFATKEFLDKIKELGDRIPKLLTALGDDDFFVRQRASEELLALAANPITRAIATKMLEDYLKTKPPLEVRRRIEEVLTAYGTALADQLRQMNDLGQLLSDLRDRGWDSKVVDRLVAALQNQRGNEEVFGNMTFLLELIANDVRLDLDYRLRAITVLDSLGVKYMYPEDIL
jgi:hypothetical protein